VLELVDAGLEDEEPLPLVVLLPELAEVVETLPVVTVLLPPPVWVAIAPVPVAVAPVPTAPVVVSPAATSRDKIFGWTLA
jgi:hypothetical protein